MHSHVPGGRGLDAARLLLTVPADDTEFQSEVRRRANLVGSTLLGTGSVARGLTDCARCGEQIVSDVVCTSCAETLADEILMMTLNVNSAMESGET